MRTVVGVLRGGRSKNQSEYEKSLRASAHLLESLNKEADEARGIFWDKTGQWQVCVATQSRERARDVSPKIIIEEHIPGKEVSVGVLDSFRGEKFYTLPPAHFTGAEHIIPGNFLQEEKRRLEDLARAAHQGFELAHYSMSDFV